MKPTIANRLWSCLATVLLFGPVYAQRNNGIEPASLKMSVPATVANSHRPDDVVNTRILRSFEQLFNGAHAPTWRPILNKKGEATNRYAVNFKIGDRAALASFTSKGRMLYTVLYGKARHLPDAERKLLQVLYEGYEITSAHLVTTLGEELWVVTLQTCTHLVKACIMNGEVEELERYRRSQ